MTDPNSQDEFLTVLSTCVETDFNVHRRHSASDLGELLAKVRRLRVNILAACPRLAYTAFDGDHLQLCAHMRRHVISCGMTPANPENILGYKHTVTSRATKLGVLQDDLSVLQHCDELWIYSEVSPAVDGLKQLAEGVLIELLFFLLLKPGQNIVFVNISDLATGRLPRVERFVQSFESCLQRLLEEGVDTDELSDCLTKAKSKLRQCVYHIFDPLDFKYSEWLREGGYSATTVPLVPGLAVDPADWHSPAFPLGHLLLSWISLMRLSDSAVILEPFDTGRKPSAVVELMKIMWDQQVAPKTVSPTSWSYYNIPKVQSPDSWSVTKHEREYASLYSETSNRINPDT